MAEQAGEDSASRWCPDDGIAQRRELRTLDGLPSLLQLACTLVEVLVKLGGQIVYRKDQISSAGHVVTRQGAVRLRAGSLDDGKLEQCQATLLRRTLR